jgi:6-phosphogluconolactonase
VRTDLPSPQAAAEAYETELREFFRAALPAFDLQLLGLGVEGHTASLFPGSHALEENQRWVIAVEVPANPPRRITLTPEVLNAAKNTFFLVAGADKREIIASLRSEPDAMPSKFPAGRIRPPGPVIWFLDEAAAR